MFGFGSPVIIDSPKDNSGIHTMETGDDDDDEFPPGTPPPNGGGN